MNRQAPLDRKKARRVPPPVPHSSWRHGAPEARGEARPVVTAAEFWERLGL